MNCQLAFSRQKRKKLLIDPLKSLQKLTANMKLDINAKTNILIGLFVASLIAANLIGTKITHVLVDFSVGIFAYPITFLITDIIEEVNGKEKAKNLVLVGFISLLLVLAITALAVSLPSAARDFFPDAYNKIFGISLRIMVASMAAFLISQYHDVWAFNFWKQKTKGKYLWLRNNLSTIVSQFIDTVIFMFIAFYAITPKHDVAYMFVLIIPYWLLKVLVAVADTPLVYAGRWWLKK